MKLEERMRSETDSQDLMEERDKLLEVLAWYDAGINHLREGLKAQISGYNELVAKHVRTRDSKKEAVSGDPPPTP